MEIIKAVEEVTGLQVPYEIGERRAGDPPALYADSSMAQAELGWKPRFMDIKETIATAWKWHQSHPEGFTN
jgi:UDP-glucose 4-epimerase